MILDLASVAVSIQIARCAVSTVAGVCVGLLRCVLLFPRAATVAALLLCASSLPCSRTWKNAAEAGTRHARGGSFEMMGLMRLRGGRKGVQAKHSSKEEALKNKLATKNMGGGKEGLQDRLGGKAGHAKLVCPLPGCNMQAPSLKNMQMHHESKHPKIPWDESIYIDVQAIHGGSTKGVAVHGTLKTDKVKAKLKKEKESAEKAGAATQKNAEAAAQKKYADAEAAAAKREEEMAAAKHKFETDVAEKKKTDPKYDETADKKRSDDALAAEKKLNDAALAAADKQLAVEMGMAQQTYDDIMANKPPPPAAALAAAAAAAKK